MLITTQSLNIHNTLIPSIYFDYNSQFEWDYPSGWNANSNESVQWDNIGYSLHPTVSETFSRASSILLPPPPSFRPFLQDSHVAIQSFPPSLPPRSDFSYMM